MLLFISKEKKKFKKFWSWKYWGDIQSRGEHSENGNLWTWLLLTFLLITLKWTAAFSLMHDIFWVLWFFSFVVLTIRGIKAGITGFQWSMLVRSAHILWIFLFVHLTLLWIFVWHSWEDFCGCDFLYVCVMLGERHLWGKGWVLTMIQT